MSAMLYPDVLVFSVLIRQKTAFHYLIYLSQWIWKITITLLWSSLIFPVFEPNVLTQCVIQNWMNLELQLIVTPEMTRTCYPKRQKTDQHQHVFDILTVHCPFSVSLPNKLREALIWAKCTKSWRAKVHPQFLNIFTIVHPSSPIQLYDIAVDYWWLLPGSMGVSINGDTQKCKVYNGKIWKNHL